MFKTQFEISILKELEIIKVESESDIKIEIIIIKLKQDISDKEKEIKDCINSYLLTLEYISILEDSLNFTLNLNQLEENISDSILESNISLNLLKLTYINYMKSLKPEVS